MRPGHHLRCDLCRASMLTRAATLTPSSILCPACAALLPPPAVSPSGTLPPASATARTGDDTTGRSSPPRLPQTG